MSVQATAHTTNQVTTENTNTNVALVGGAVGGALGATLLGLIGVLLWRRKRRTPASSPDIQRPFFGQQLSSQPITPASPTFSTDTGYPSGPPVTHAAQYGWRFQQPLSSVLSEGAGAPVVGRMSTASNQSALPTRAVNSWVERPPTIHQENYGEPTPQSRASLSSPAEGPLDPRQFYSDALQGSAYSAVAPVNVPPLTSGGSGGPPPPAAAYPDVSRTGKF